MKTNINLRRPFRRPAAEIILQIFALLLVALLFVAALPVSAAKDYQLPASGKLLYIMDFRQKTGWSPKKSARATGTLSLVANELDCYEATLSTTVNQACSNWGGEIEGLPLNEYTAYTVFFTLTRSSETASKDPNLAVYLDGYYGFYAYSTNLRLLDDMTTLSGHSTYTFADVDSTILGNTWEAEGKSVEYYAMEINGYSKTLRVFLQNADNKYVLIDGSSKGEISSFHTDNLGLWFHQYNTGMPITVGYLTIWDGNLLTGEKAKEPVSTASQAQTQSVPEETSAPAEDSSVSAESTVIADESADSAGADTSASGTSGCQSAAFMPAAVLPAAAFMLCRRRKKNIAAVS